MIATSDLPVELRRASALEVIRQTPARTTSIAAFLRLIDPACFPELRAWITDPQESGTLHFHAAATLAEPGDQEILPNLEAWRTRLKAEFRPSHQYVDGYLWKIRIQHPPSNLVNYIASTEGLHSRTWAIERAIALKVPKNKVRKAILAHADKVGQVGDKRLRRGLRPLKSTGIRLGLLQEDDLPDVELPEKGPVP